MNRIRLKIPLTAIFLWIQQWNKKRAKNKAPPGGFMHICKKNDRKGAPP